MAVLDHPGLMLRAGEGCVPLLEIHPISVPVGFGAKKICTVYVEPIQVYLLLLHRDLLL